MILNICLLEKPLSRIKGIKGNINESETLLKMVKQLDTDEDNNQRKTVIIDAGLSRAF